MCAKKRHSKGSDFLHYLKDELSMQERHELERSLEADPFEREAMEGWESIGPEKAEEDLYSLHASLNRRLSRKRRRTWYSIAATAASILLMGTIFLNIYDLNPDRRDTEVLSEETFRDLKESSKPPEAASTEIEEPATSKKATAPPKVVLEDEIVLDMASRDDAGIVAVEAEPHGNKRSVSREKMAAPTAYTPEAVAIPKEQAEQPAKAAQDAMATQDVMAAQDAIAAQDDKAGAEARAGQVRDLERKSSPTSASTISEEKGERTASPGSAEPAGGFKSFRDYLKENMVFPEEYSPGERMLVILSFTVKANGTIENIETLRSPGEAYTLEARRLIQDGPDWIPAQSESGPIDEQVRLRIVFKK